jgi:hypothetical protein
VAAPKGFRARVEFSEWFPEGLYLVGEIQPAMEYQSSEDKARNRPARQRVDEVTGLPLFRGMFMDPSAEKDREKSIPVEFTAKVQPVPPPSVQGLPIRPVELEGMTVQPRAETSGPAKWITWTVRATGLQSPMSGSATSTGASKPTAKSSASGDASKPAA